MVIAAAAAAIQVKYEHQESPLRHGTVVALAAPSQPCGGIILQDTHHSFAEEGAMRGFTTDSSAAAAGAGPRTNVSTLPTFLVWCATAARENAL